MQNKTIASWEKNAKEWIRVIDSEQIASRRFTNQAIENMLRQTPGTKFLDIGCGEGWLTRSLTSMGKAAAGLDAIEALLANARKKGPEAFYQMSFQDIAGGAQVPGFPYDAAVFNFCIYQRDGLELLLLKTKKSLTPNGKIIIQTLHPYFLISNGLEYKSQTIPDSWKGLPGNFTDGHSWYARTFEDWIAVIAAAGLNLLEVRETLNAEKKPVSLILVMA